MKNRLRKMKGKLYYNLLEIIEKQDEIICKQNQMLFSLINENAEKENMINVLMQKQDGMY